MHKRIRFSLSSEQCELLEAFETAGSLSELARIMAKDVSVVSRNLQALAESGVLEKVNGRWTITTLGRQVNHWTRSAAASQAKIIDQQARLRFLDGKQPHITATTALILVGVQKGFEDPAWGPRNNLDAEDNMLRLLSAWRRKDLPIYHVPHHSKEPNSPLRGTTQGVEIKDFATPLKGEIILPKVGNSAFVGTDLEKMLKAQGCDAMVLCGFTTNHCIDATARMAGDLGFSTLVVSDACVAFDRMSFDGTLVRADQTHKVVMSNLHQEFATVTESEAVLAYLEHGAVGIPVG
jgi:nicotinamidase-related amidase